jgi:hypothetical protein
MIVSSALHAAKNWAFRPMSQNVQSYFRAIAVQLGCTNLGLGTTLHSRTDADDQGCIGCSQARAKTEYEWRMESVEHTLMVGEYKANSFSAGGRRVLQRSSLRGKGKDHLQLERGTWVVRRCAARYHPQRGRIKCRPLRGPLSGLPTLRCCLNEGKRLAKVLRNHRCLLRADFIEHHSPRGIQLLQQVEVPNIAR